jgi:ABC-type glycerol-3-phosphate transport system substrate-binding protein
VIHFRFSGLVVACVLLVGCSRETPSLRIAINSGVEGVALKLAAAEFSEERDVVMEIDEFPYDDLYDAEMKAVHGDLFTAASRVRGTFDYDVILLDDPWLTALLGDPEETGDAGAVLTTAGGLLVLDDLLLDREVDFVASCLEVCRDRRVDGGSYYAVPYVGNTQLFVYRGTEASTEDWDWERVTRFHQEEARMSRLGYAVRVRTGNSIVTDFIPIWWASLRDLGADPYGSTDPARRAALATLKELGGYPRGGEGAAVNEGESPPDWAPNLSLIAADDFDLAIHLVEDTAGMSVIWSAWIMAMTRAWSDAEVEIQDPAEGRLFVGEVPGGYPVLGAWLLAIPARSRNSDLAREFIGFATEPREFLHAVGGGNPPPVETDVLEAESEGVRDRLEAVFPWFECQELSLRSARPRPPLRAWRVVEGELGDILTRVLTGTADIESALTGMREIDRRHDGALMAIERQNADHAERGLGRVSCNDRPLLSSSIEE